VTNVAEGTKPEKKDKGSAPFQWRSAKRGLLIALGPAFYLGALVLVAFTSWAAYGNWAESGWGPDAAAWVQAAGSIAAIAGAAWLAQSEGRRARRTRRLQNEEAAWFVRFALVQAQLEAHIIANELINRVGPIGLTDVRSWRQRVATCCIGLDTFISRTDQIHPAVVHVLSNAKVLMDDMLEDIRSFSTRIEAGQAPDKETIGRLVEPHHSLQQLIELFDSRMAGVRLALDEGGDILPVRRWQSERSKAPKG
jgi:hypothetical protein